MNVIAQLSAALAALIVIAAFPLEAFLIDRPGLKSGRHLSRTDWWRTGRHIRW